MKNGLKLAFFLKIETKPEKGPDGFVDNFQGYTAV